MTDSEIIKALECCSMGSYPACRDCPYHDDYVNRGCINKRNADIKDLIKRQKTEIEKLQETGKEAVNCFTRMESLYKIKCKELEVAKSEAIKEFAEKVDYLACTNNGIPNRAYRKLSSDIKKLAKEMLGDDNA